MNQPPATNLHSLDALHQQAAHVNQQLTEQAPNTDVFRQLSQHLQSINRQASLATDQIQAYHEQRGPGGIF